MSLCTCTPLWVPRCNQGKRVLSVLSPAQHSHFLQRTRQHTLYYKLYNLYIPNYVQVANWMGLQVELHAVQLDSMYIFLQEDV